MDWQPFEGNQKRCVRHDEVFSKTTTCSKCFADPSAKIDAIAPVTTDKELDLFESEFRQAAKELRRIASDMMASKPERATAIKFYDTALKYDRAALEICIRRKEREHDRWLVEENRKLQSGGSH